MPQDVKICGLKTPDAVAAALSGGATHLGFIFFAPSPRDVAPDEAGRLREAARGRALVVAVTVDADDDAIARIFDAVAPDLLQFHGRESPARVAAAKARFGLPAIKAFPLREPADLQAVSAYRGVADHLLFDAKPPAGATLPGGNGIAFDWRILSGFDAPFFLSGGLHAGNVADAVRSLRPAGLDASSGLETAPGVKDPSLIAAFLAAARQARADAVAA